MASIKVLKKIHQQNERVSLVKELIALRPISPVVTRQNHPFQTIYHDTNPPPVAIDQFAPYLSRKLALKRNAQIEKIRKKKKPGEPPTFVLTNAVDARPGPERHAQTAGPIRETKVADDPVDDHPSARFGPAHSLASHLKMEETFDKIAANASSTALHRLIESTLQVFFLAERVLFYHDISGVKVLYCPSTTAYCPHGSGLVGFAQFSRKTIVADQASDHAAYSLVQEGVQCPPNSHVLIFPLFDSSSHVRGVVQVIRGHASPTFTEEDVQFAEYFQAKCKMYARWLFQPVLDDSFASDLMQTCRLRQFVERMREKLTRLFSCRSAELWNYNRQTEVIEQYMTTSDRPVPVPANEAGIPGFALRQQVPVSCISCRVHSAYNPKTDGNGDYSCLIIPVRDPDSPLIYALVLRGKRMPQFFTDNDEKILARIAAYVISSLSSAEVMEKNHRALKDSMHQQKRLRSLLDVAETLAGQLRMDVLIPKIMQRACELVKADRCSLFMVNETRDKLVTSFQGGLANAIEIPLTAGVVGWTATTGKVLNVKDAYEDPRFNRNMDLATGYRTLTLLCVPIFDEKRDVRGVTEMINKLDGVFTEEDEKLIQIFNVFVGISIENARLYRASIDLSLQLRSFLDISYSLSQPQTIKKMMKEILSNTRKVLGAVRALLFMIDNSGISFEPFVVDEDADAMYKKTQQKKQEEAQDTLGVKRAIIAKLMHGKQHDVDAEAQKEEQARNQLVENAISMKQSVLENDQQNPEKSLIIVPILSSDRACLGAVMMQWKKTGQKFTFDDQKLLESYSVFLSLSLERSKLKNITQLGTMEVELQAWVTVEEREAPAVPEKLKMTDEERSELLKLSFDSFAYQGAQLAKVIFNIFDMFGLLGTLKIPAQCLFALLYELKQAYNPVPYHNWNHAVDTTQLLAYEIYYGNLQSALTPREILLLLVAALCHDVNHDGFSTTYNVKAEVPLAVLFNNQAVLETHHCTVAISILTKDETNIFACIPESEIEKTWGTFIALILGTDMDRHFDVINEMNQILKSGKGWQSNEKSRLTFMQLLLKCADLGTAIRPFHLADKFEMNVCEEFFQQGKLEKVPSLVYEKGFRDRRHLNKEASQLPFYKFVAVPLYETLAKCVTQLAGFVKHLGHNIAHWETKAAKLAEQEKERERAKAEEEAKQRPLTQREEEEKVEKSQPPTARTDADEETKEDAK